MKKQFTVIDATLPRTLHFPPMRAHINEYPSWYIEFEYKCYKSKHPDATKEQFVLETEKTERQRFHPMARKKFLNRDCTI